MPASSYEQKAFALFKELKRGDKFGPHDEKRVWRQIGEYLKVVQKRPEDIGIRGEDADKVRRALLPN